MKNRILCIHSIDSKTLEPLRFERYVKSLKVLGLKFVPLEEVIHEKGKRNLVSLTVDDGYLNNITNLLPILKKYKIPATLFISPGRFNLKKNDPLMLESRMYPDQDTISWNDLKEWIRNGHSFGFHTNTHLDLFESTLEDIEADFKAGIAEIKNKGFQAPRFFAYPFGFLPKEQRDFEEIMSEFGIEYAFTVNWGSVDRRNPFYVNRVCLGDKDSLGWSILKTLGFLDWYYNIRYINEKNRISDRRVRFFKF